MVDGGVRLIAVLSVTLAICLGWGWIEAFYRHVFVNSQLAPVVVSTYRDRAGSTSMRSSSPSWASIFSATSSCPWSMQEICDTVSART